MKSSPIKRRARTKHQSVVAHPSDSALALVTLANDRGAAVIDAKHATAVGQYLWTLVTKSTVRYAVTHMTVNGSAKSLPLHRLIASLMGIDASPQIDHINHDGLDCREANLRGVTVSQNQANSRKLKARSSRFKGVCWNKRGSKWVASAKVNRKSKFLGYYPTEELAALAYNEFATATWGSYACLNDVTK